jgi:hypothetical protein
MSIYRARGVPMYPQHSVASMPVPRVQILDQFPEQILRNTLVKHVISYSMMTVEHC